MRDYDVENAIQVTVVIVAVSLFLFWISYTVYEVPTHAQVATAGNETFVTFEGTQESTQDALPGHQMHQAIVVLPARVDGDLWVGTISWVSSKPVELRLLYDYNFNLHPDAKHGVPPTTLFQLGKQGQVAISLIKPTNVITTGGTYYAGSMQFVAKAVALHNILGIPFTATYAVDAVAKPMTK
jgi:hypothetical protein